jgi:hypothetical protein
MVPTRTPAAPELIPAAPAGPPVESVCALHEHQPAVAVCDRCGDFICLLCLTPFEGRAYCLRCFELLWDRGELGRRKLPWRVWENPGLASALAAVAWMLTLAPFLPLLPAMGGVLIALAALRRIRLEPSREGRGMAVGALVAAGLAMVASVLITVVFYL